MDIERIQTALSEHQLDGWLFFDHHRRDPLAYRILQIPDKVESTRRWYYFVPAQGNPRKLVHRIESGALDTLPGHKDTYASWTDQQNKLHAILSGHRRIAMQYSPNCAIPYVSLVDGGTLELVRQCGAEVVSSADLVQEFEACWTQEQFDSHLQAGSLVDQARSKAFDLIGERLRSNVRINEYEVQQFILHQFSQHNLTTNHGPIVAVNANASDPHYEPAADRNSEIRWNDVVLIDLWAKQNQPQAVYYDVTWTGFCGEAVPDEVQKVFEIVRDARKKACEFVSTRMTQALQPTEGWEVDDIAREHIASHGYGDFFFHRTGHSIGTEVHGTGANMDNLESHDQRRIIANTCFSVEPGIYLPKFGIRSEVNVFVRQSSAQVTGAEQEELIHI
ncbi:MAG: aminopeptidase P family protein [Acidobacteriaceae bacterium]|nr:aminopeptidase P family protein [Acidobacteriaceae bacterium]